MTPPIVKIVNLKSAHKMGHKKRRLFLSETDLAKSATGFEIQVTNMFNGKRSHFSKEKKITSNQKVSVKTKQSQTKKNSKYLNITKNTMYEVERK